MTYVDHESSGTSRSSLYPQSADGLPRRRSGLRSLPPMGSDQSLFRRTEEATTTVRELVRYGAVVPPRRHS